jgi:alpha-glucosidase
MDLDDQTMIDNYYKIAGEAAKRRLMVDFHGSAKPDGIQGPYPNVLTRDLAPGLEFNKWEGQQANPEMAVTLPFIRMVAGPMDYTPGAMVNATREDYIARFKNPMSLGTRCQQMAMFIVYESPLMVMADNPSNYLREEECTRFIAHVPTTWDKTVVPAARVGDYLVVARQKDDDWYLGAMTDWDARTVTIRLSFLDPHATYEMEFFRDGINADRNAMDYKKEVKEVTCGQELTIDLAPGGGWAARLVKKAI